MGKWMFRTLPFGVDQQFTMRISTNALQLITAALRVRVLPNLMKMWNFLFVCLQHLYGHTVKSLNHAFNAQIKARVVYGARQGSSVWISCSFIPASILHACGENPRISAPCSYCEWGFSSTIPGSTNPIATKRCQMDGIFQIWIDGRNDDLTYTIQKDLVAFDFQITDTEKNTEIPFKGVSFR